MVQDSNKRPEVGIADARAAGKGAARDGAVVLPRSLYLVATPIGNLRDITLRALDVLGAVDRILAEDTRHTRKILSHYGVAARIESYHEHNEQRRAAEVVRRLGEGESAALVTDAGMPSVSDPGFRLVRAALDAGLAVIPVPGPSASLAALVVSGLPTDRFAFLGYPPRKAAERCRFFEEIREFAGTLVLFESPRRIAATLRSAAETLGASRPAVVGRELTKLHEELLRGTLGDLAVRLSEPLRGEVTLCIGPAPAAKASVPEPEELRRRYRELLASGTPRKEAQRTLVAETGLRRRDIYDAVVLDGSAPIPSHRETDP
jgi:16S rRNA (cytidine1402-2'-O)-methyltransferase